MKKFRSLVSVAGISLVIISLFLAAHVQGQDITSANAVTVLEGTTTDFIAPAVFQAAGPNIASIQGSVNDFRDALGAPNGNTLAEVATGRREINWDGAVPTDVTTAPVNPFNTFLNNRGAQFTTPGIGLSQAPPSGGPQGGLVALFGNATYATAFRVFSSPRLFTPVGSNITELDLGLTDLPFEVANIRAENGPADAHVRIGWFRAVSNNFHAFAAHSFADEMARAAGRDSLEFLLDLLGPGKVVDLKGQGVEYSNYGAPYDKYPIDTRRLRRVLQIAGERSNWGKKKAGNGWGIGIAAHRSFNSYVASVVEVEIDSRGSFKVPRIDQVVDAGVIVNPDRVRSQLEGAAVMAVGLARTGEITAAAGRIKQSNFHDFQVARMPDAPYQVNVHFVDSDALPTGVGEPGLPPVLAALGNAIFAATGKRVRELPLSKTQLT